MAEPLNENKAPGAVDRAHAAHIERLIQGHFGFVWRLLRRIGLAEDRVDAAAEQVFVAAAQRIGDIRPGSERSFLFSTAMHVASLARRERQESGAEVDPGAQNAGAPALEDLDEQAQAREILDALLAQMSLELRVVFVLHEIEQLTSLDIAEVVGIPVSVVESRLSLAAEGLANHVEAGTGLLGSLVSAACEEQPRRAALERASAAVGVAPGSVRPRRAVIYSSGPPRMVALGSSRKAGPSSALALVAKWLAAGVAIGLLATSAVYAVRDVVASSAHPASSRP